ncbi:MAG TPA: alpha/beta fold hydrolase [Longimicrobiales bacterium]|nr:alpha/beta fold hydrolase [Longimicrobiales bacterium]
MAGPAPPLLVRRVEVQGRAARVLEAGGGPPVVLVHGIGLAADVWRRSLDVLAGAGRRVVAPDLPGFGGSPGPLRGMDTARLVAWLHAFSEAVGVAGAAWAGHSLLARAVLRVAAERRDTPALALISPTTVHGHRRSVRQAALLARDAARERPRVLWRVLRHYVRASPTAAVGTWLRDDGVDLATHAPRVRCPTLVAAGVDDPMSAPGELERLAEAFPRGRLVRVPGTAHGLALDARGTVAELLRTFLDGASAPPASGQAPGNG